MNRFCRSLAILLCTAAAAWASPQYAGGQSESRRLNAEIREAQAALNRAILQARREFLESADYQNALFELRSASAEHRSARDAALASVRRSPQYLSIRIKTENMHRDLEATRGGPRGADAASRAASLLALRGELSAMEADVLAADDSYHDARYALIDANIRLASLRREFEQTVRSDPLIAAARERVAAARQRLRDSVRR